MIYACSHCNAEHPHYRLSCPECGQWNSLRSTQVVHPNQHAFPIALSDIKAHNVPRTTTANTQLDAILGGGFVPGSTILLIGPPGAGKSTLVMQTLSSMNKLALYATGEESVQQMKVRADRLGINSLNIFILFEPNVNKISLHAGASAIKVLVIDSIQTMYTDVSDALPGSPTQIRKCAYILRRAAQRNNFVLIIVGQVTKEKKAAGPMLLEHAVDVVLSLTIEEDAAHHRTLVATKNRFGSTDPWCELVMKESGLEFL
jgi:DNA repair protein RadA/Sms